MIFSNWLYSVEKKGRQVNDEFEGIWKEVVVA
jgi:hypothetical protein